MSKLFFVFLFAIISSSCSNTDFNGVAFPTYFPLDEFNLDKEYQYIEIRRDNFGSDDKSFDIVHQLLIDGVLPNATIQAELDDMTSSTGFYYGCFPAGCPFYAVTLTVNNEINVWDSKQAMFDAFVQIDTVAEVYFWLKYSGFEPIITPKSYKIDEDGSYLVEADWDTVCQLQGRSIFKVTPQGTVSEFERIKEEKYDSCA